MSNVVRKRFISMLLSILLVMPNVLALQTAYAAADSRFIPTAEYVRAVPGSEIQNAETIEFDTFYNTEESGYVLVKPYKDCVYKVLYGDNSVGSEAVHGTGNQYNQYVDSHFLQGGLAYQLYLDSQVSTKVVAYYDMDDYGDTEDSAYTVQMDREYAGTCLATDEGWGDGYFDTDLFQFTAGRTGDAFISINVPDQKLEFKLQYARNKKTIEEKMLQIGSNDITVHFAQM